MYRNNTGYTETSTEMIRTISSMNYFILVMHMFIQTYIYFGRMAEAHPRGF